MPGDMRIDSIFNLLLLNCPHIYRFLPAKLFATRAGTTRFFLKTLGFIQQCCIASCPLLFRFRRTHWDVNNFIFRSSGGKIYWSKPSNGCCMGGQSHERWQRVLGHQRFRFLDPWRDAWEHWPPQGSTSTREHQLSLSQGSKYKYQLNRVLCRRVPEARGHYHVWFHQVGSEPSSNKISFATFASFICLSFNFESLIADHGHDQFAYHVWSDPFEGSPFPPVTLRRSAPRQC